MKYELVSLFSLFVIWTFYSKWFGMSLSLLSFCQGYVRSLSPPLVSCLLCSTAKLDKSIIEKKKKRVRDKVFETFHRKSEFSV